MSHYDLSPKGICVKGLILYKCTNLIAKDISVFFLVLSAFCSVNPLLTNTWENHASCVCHQDR